MWRAKMEPAQNDTQTILKSFQKRPGDRLVIKQAEQVVDVDSML